MLFGLLNFGEGNLAFNYLIFCIVAFWGALQVAAAHGQLVGLVVLPARFSVWLGSLLIAAAYVWFFAAQPDLFIPGLAGGELFTLAALGFGIAIIMTLAVRTIVNRLFLHRGVRLPLRREVIALGKGKHAELWLPADASTHSTGLRRSETSLTLPPLVLALREAGADSLDMLCAQFVGQGVAVLITNYRLAAEAIEFARQNKARFNPARWYVTGVGRGANRALELAEGQVKFKAVVALAPYVNEAAARPGLRWLRETDWLSALDVLFASSPMKPPRGNLNALVVYGDEDRLISIAEARETLPNLMVVAGGRHMTLAAMPASLALTADAFEIHLQAALQTMRVPTRRPLVGGEFGE